MRNKLPRGWTWTKMLDILDYEGGSQPPKKEFVYEPRKGFVRLLQIRDFGEKPFPTYVPDSKRLKKATQNDLLLARYGGSSGCDSLGRICTGLEGAYNVALAKLVFSPELLDKDYVRYLFLGPWFREKVSRNSRSCQTGFNRNDVKDIVFPIAPLAEQRRIVKKLDKVLDEVERSQGRLSKIPNILRRFRQSVLSAACSGRLTADWRDKNSNSEPYLKATPSERQIAVEALPINWWATQLGSLTTLVTSGSRGWAKYYADSGSIFIRAQNINSDVLNLEDIAFVKLPNRAEGVRTKVQQYDLLITITGANVTKSALVEKPLDDAYVSQHVALVRLADIELSRFVFYSILSLEHGRKQLQAAAYGQGKPGLNLDNIRDLILWIPPVAEQYEIVKRVESLFALANEIEARFEKAQAQVDKLTPSILSKAFRGELVPQESRGASPEELTATAKRAPITAEDSNVVYFEHVTPRREDRYVHCVPSLNLEIAAGAFGDDQKPDFNEWVEINATRPLKKGMFVAKVTGRSMEPLIPDGAHCLFQFKAPQLRNDMVAIFQLHDSEDPESGGHYTVKRLRVYRQNTDEGVVRKAKLMPENPAFQPITVDEDNVKFVAEFLEVLQPLTKVKNRLR